MSGTDFTWLPGSGPMASRVRAHDWSATPLGPVETWPAELKAATTLVLDSAFAAALVWGEDYTTIHNDGFLAILGDKPDALGRSFADIWAEAWPRIEPIVTRAYAGDATRIEDFRVEVDRLGKAEPAWFTFACSPVRRGDGRVAGMIDIVIETTDVVRARLALEGSEARFRTFAAANSDAVYRLSPDWRDMRRIEGRPFVHDADRAAGTWLDRYVHPDDRPRVDAAIGRAIATRSTFELEHRVIRLDGTPGWTLSRAVPILSADGAIVEWLGSASDITAATEAARTRADAEAAARESAAHQAFLLSLCDALRPGGDAAYAQEAAGRLIGERLAVAGAGYGEIDPDGETIEVKGDWHRAGAARVLGRFEIDRFGTALTDALRQGRTAAMDDAASDPRLREGGCAANWAALGVRSAVACPIVKDGRLAAIFFVHDDKTRAWSAKEIALVGEVADRTAEAVDRARTEAALRDAEERFRQFGEASQDVLWTRDARTLDWEYLTPAFEAIYGLPREQALCGDSFRNWLELVVPEDRDRVQASIARVRNGTQVTFDYRIRRPVDGEIRWLRDTDFPIRDERRRVTRIGGVGHDATELKSVEEALTAAEQRQRVLVEGIPQLVWRAVDGGEWTWASPQWTAYTGQTSDQSRGWGWLEPLHPDDREIARAAWATALETGGFEVEYRLRHAASGADRWFQTRAMPVRNEAGDIVEWLGTSTDIDELSRLQERQRLLLAELQHRVRNILTVVRSVFTRSAESAGSIEDIADHFRGRLDSMARTQVMFTRHASGMVDLEELIRDELMSVGASDGPTIAIEGPEVALPSRIGESMALAVHELATNALKYGALKVPSGRLAIRWIINIDYGEERRLHFTWSEQGIPAVPVKPNRRGFGSELIEEALPYRLGAETSLEFRGGGVCCTINVPLPPDDAASAADSWKGF